MAAPPVLVVGAGLAGLAAARALVAAGHPVVVVERGRAPGGRLATRRLGRAALDHGAQFFTVRTPELQHQVDDWLARGLVRTWCHGFGEEPDGHPRYVAVDGMAALARDLAAGLDVRTGLAVEALVPGPGGWVATFTGGAAEPAPADGVVATAPTPELQAILAAGGVRPSPEAAAALAQVRYRPVLALLVRLDADPGLPPPGARQQPDDDTFTFVADARAKGTSPEPALTLHTSHELSERLWRLPDAEVRRQLLDLARPHLGPARPLEVQLVRWRHATPTSPWPAPSVLAAHAPGPLALAGDAFGGPRVEGAFRSGLAAAALVADALG